MKDMFLIALEGASLVTEHTYIYLLIPVCLIYLFFRNKMPAPRIFFIQGTLLLFFIYFCPISAMVIHFCLLNSVYNRALWLIPFVPLVCYTTAHMLLHFQGRKRFGLFAALLLFIMTSGTYMLREPNFHKASNPYKLTQESIDTADFLPDGAHVVGANWLVPFIRQYNPTITLVNDRWQRTSIDAEFAKEHPDLTVLGPLLQSSNCDFIAIGQDLNMTVIGKWEDYGFHFYAGDNRCIIFINENSSFYNGEP